MFQPSLLASAEAPGFDAGLDGARRRFLGSGAWLDIVPGWVRGADALFERVLEEAPWQARTRKMWDQIVDEPRLSTHGWAEPSPPAPAMADSLSVHYGLDLTSISANLYRDGQDSVAWHGDRIGRVRADAVVAILSLGSDRTLLLRPNGGGRSITFSMHSGDLVVQGGTCQRTFEHCVPKRAHAGPRISVMFRQPGGN